MVREHCASMLPFTIPQTAVERYKKLWQNGGVRYAAGDLCVPSRHGRRAIRLFPHPQAPDHRTVLSADLHRREAAVRPHAGPHEPVHEKRLDGR